MKVVLGRIGTNSKRVRVPIEVFGGPGEVVDCEGVKLGEDVLELSPNVTVDEIAAAVVERAIELNEAGYVAWVLHNEVAVAVRTAFNDLSV